MKLLADPTRLRILCLLSAEELAVAELQSILDMGQSRISSHLALMRQAELVIDRKAGKRTYYCLQPELSDASRTLVKAAVTALSDSPEFEADRAGLERVLARRRRVSEDYFNTMAGRLDKKYCPGRSWEGIAHLLLHLVPCVEIADLGAGEGVIGNLMARRAKRVYCVDNARKMVQFGSEMAKRYGIDNLEYRLGDIEAVPLEDASVDVALLSQALHHALHPETALAEARRILRPEGLLLILDLNEHNFEQARTLYADRWLGFNQNTLYRWLKEAGFVNAEVSLISREPEPPQLETLLATARKPEA